jgi:aminoglycoside phosphotransferase family enzyme
MSGEPRSIDLEEAEIRAFLARSDPLSGHHIEVFETHCAVVFVGSAEALKVKRRVKYPYLDFSTLEKRRAACEREITINQPAAPEIYLGTVAITREGDGTLALAGAGEPVEWAVRMRRFAQKDLLSSLIEAGPLAPELVKSLGDMVAAYHDRAPVVHGVDTTHALETVADEVASGLERTPCVDAAVVATWRRAVARQLDNAAPVLAERAAQGCVRRCHGDLHLANIVLWRDRPVAFDAIEFDERIATIDTLYDLAFLLMDLDRRGHRREANQILNRVLWRSQKSLDVSGLVALPVMLSLRAGIRALVATTRAGLAQPARRHEDEAQARAYLAAAVGYLKAARPRLIAIGGLSGTGKSTLAAALAPLLEPAPGALHLRTDLERKAMMGVEEFAVLPPESYTPRAAAAVYGHIERRAGMALRAGWPVVVDAVSLLPAEREALATLARRNAVPFHGFWLQAPLELLASRVEARRNDASDATAAVVRLQATRVAGPPPDWTLIDASGTAETTLAAVLEHI